METDPKWRQLHGGSCGKRPNLNAWPQLPHPAGVKARCETKTSSLRYQTCSSGQGNGLAEPQSAALRLIPEKEDVLGQTFTRLCLELFVSTVPECKPLLHQNHTFQIYSDWNNLSGSLISSPPNVLVTSDTLQHALLMPMRGEAHKLVLEIL